MIGRKGVTLTALQIREHDDLPSAFMHAYKGQRGQHTKKTIVNNSTAAIRTANRNNHPVCCNQVVVVVVSSEMYCVWMDVYVVGRVREETESVLCVVRVDGTNLPRPL